MPFKVIVTSDFDHMSEVAAALAVADMRRRLAAQDAYVLGLATGNTPTGLYKHLAKAANAGEVDSSRMVSFNLDEYVGLPGENAQQRALHKESYSFFMVQELFGLLQNKPRETNVPWGTLIDRSVMEAELKAHPDDWTMQGSDEGRAIVIRQDARSDYLRWIRREILDAYAEKIARCGGVDLHVVGVGGRGHVGFHEVGVPFENNEVILVRLDGSTIKDALNDGHFEGMEQSSLYAVTMGAELIYRARTVLLLAHGRRKADPIADSLLMEPDCSVPISYGQVLAQRGGDMIYVIDRLAAAGVLAQADAIRARGIEVEDLSSGRASVPVANLQFSRDPKSGLIG